MGLGWRGAGRRHRHHGADRAGGLARLSVVGERDLPGGGLLHGRRRSAGDDPPAREPDRLAAAGASVGPHVQRAGGGVREIRGAGGPGCAARRPLGRARGQRGVAAAVRAHDGDSVRLPRRPSALAALAEGGGRRSRVFCCGRTRAVRLPRGVRPAVRSGDQPRRRCARPGLGAPVRPARNAGDDGRRGLGSPRALPARDRDRAAAAQVAHVRVGPGPDDRGGVLPGRRRRADDRARADTDRHPRRNRARRAALSPLRHRRRDQPHPGVRRADRGAGGDLRRDRLGSRGGGGRRVGLDHRLRDACGGGGIHAGTRADPGRRGSAVRTRPLRRAAMRRHLPLRPAGGPGRT